MNTLSLIYNNSKILPDSIAISYRSANEWLSLTWENFWNEIGKTYNALVDLGLKKEDRIGIFSQNSKEWVITDFAAQAIGATPVPIYATNSKEQTEYIVQHTEMQHILVGDQPQLDIVRSIASAMKKPLQIITAKKSNIQENNIHDFTELTKKYNPEFTYTEPEADSLATIIYTSGTTGTPKGVMLTHKNFSAIGKAHKEFFNIKNLYNKKSLAFLPLSHIFERAWTSFVLSQGGEVALLDDPKDVLSALKQTKPWTMCSVPRFYEKVYQTLIRKIESASTNKKKLFINAVKVGKKHSDRKNLNQSIPFALSLKHKFYNNLVFKKIRNEFGGNLSFLPVGGALLKKEIVEFFTSIGMPITVGYGLSETCATVSAYPLKNIKYGSIGRPLPGVDVKLSEENEILVKYGGVMKGYYKSPEETAKVFTDDGYLKTGDKGEMDAEGNLYIVDRIKDLMKTSYGKYIAPQTIEIPLQSHPKISQAMVIADGRPFVTAIITPNFEFLIEDKPEFKNYMNLSLEEKTKLINSPEMMEEYATAILSVQKDQADFEKIKRFILLPEDLTIDKGELTPTLKIKRKVVMDKFADKIEALYTDR